MLERCYINGLCILTPEVNEDYFGSHMEIFNKEVFKAYGINNNFIQENQSYSVKGVLRGLHLQKKYPTAKMIRVIRGSIFDVAVDLRKGSFTFGEWYGIELSEKNRKQLLVPEGFLHGFLVISDEAEVCFKVTEYWHPNDEIGVIWNDPQLNIKWPVQEKMEIIISERDCTLPKLQELRLF